MLALGLALAWRCKPRRTCTGISRWCGCHLSSRDYALAALRSKLDSAPPTASHAPRLPGAARSVSSNRCRRHNLEAIFRELRNRPQTVIGQHRRRDQTTGFGHAHQDYCCPDFRIVNRQCRYRSRAAAQHFRGEAWRRLALQSHHGNHQRASTPNDEPIISPGATAPA
jgi:hypothetical protein